MAQLSVTFTNNTAKAVGAARLGVVLLLTGLLLVGPFSGSLLALQGQININRATTEELTALPFTGRKRAQAIVDYRRQHGPFESPEELLKVGDIGPSTLEAIKPYIKLVGPSTLQAKKNTGQPGTEEQPTATYDRQFNVQSRVITRPGEVMLLPDQLYFDTLRSFINMASQRIELAMFLFKTTDSPDNRPAALLQSLVDARRRGVEVKVVLEDSGYDDKLNATNRKAARLLARNKIQVGFDSKNQTSHMKLVVIDNRFCFIGSHNLTHAALAFNHELSVLLDNSDLARDLSRYIAILPVSAPTRQH